MKDNYTHISFLVDRSGSMSIVKNSTIEGILEFLNLHKSLPGECTLSLVQFDNLYEYIYDFDKISDIDTSLINSKYIPRGSTALIESMIRLIKDTGTKLAAMNEEDRPSKVIFACITDGEENSSNKLYTNEMLKDLILEHTNVWKWEFTYLGANHDAFLVAKSFGINESAVLNYLSTAKGTKNSFIALATATARYRTASDNNMAYTNTEIDSANEK